MPGRRLPLFIAAFGLALSAAAAACSTPQSPPPPPRGAEPLAEPAPPAPHEPDEPDEPDDTLASAMRATPPAIGRLVAVRSDALKRAIDGLPVIARIDDAAPTPFVLRGRLSRRRAKAMERMARDVVRDVARRFVGGPISEAHEVVDVCLFEDDASYRAFAGVSGDRDSMMGFYVPSQRLIVANLGRSVGNLRHELVHPLVGDDFRASRQRIPAWFNEGLASLYGTSRVKSDGVRFLVNYRLRHVRAALRAGRLPTLETVASSGRDELYGPRGSTFYGTSRYLLLYLDSRGELSAFYRALRGDVSASGQIALLQKKIDYDGFVHWTRRLKKGRLAPRAR